MDSDGDGSPFGSPPASSPVSPPVFSSGSSSGTPLEFSPEFSPVFSSESSSGSPHAGPCVTMEELPFYEVCAEIVKPTRLVPEDSFTSKNANLLFVASSELFDKILNSKRIELLNKNFSSLQLLLRMCVWNTQHPQADRFPLGLMVSVNQQSLDLGESDHIAQPLSITHLVHLSDTVANRILISWSPNETRDFAVAVYLVMKLTVDDLLKKMWADSIWPADETRALIQEKLEDDSEDSTTESLYISLMCPVENKRVFLPCRALTCSHLEVFDAARYLQLNEEEGSWICPVCHSPAPFSKLILDRYFLDVLEANILCEEIVIYQDGSWKPILSDRDLFDFCDYSPPRYKKLTVSQSTTESSSSEGDKEFEHAPKRLCPTTTSTIPAATIHVTCSPTIELPSSPWAGPGTADLLSEPPTSPLPSSSASTVEQEHPVTVQSSAQAQNVQAPTLELLDTLLQQMNDYARQLDFPEYVDYHRDVSPVLFAYLDPLLFHLPALLPSRDPSDPSPLDPTHYRLSQYRWGN
ncbi:E3 SUMO-protein ligase PIAS3-like [Tachyglossus aculeatus]|uniref:E3 SUMO-protein ligase PIAS3-like n=1 Tax=Tachyglossus aculeatus TaxID=9261 RepID=UPI0018F2EA33|nr:E3 SUMO-protein ligase PIAS3-like [Tachyglossus aculeatus]